MEIKPVPDQKAACAPFSCKAKKLMAAAAIIMALSSALLGCASGPAASPATSGKLEVLVGGYACPAE